MAHIGCCEVIIRILGSSQENQDIRKNLITVSRWILYTIIEIITTYLDYVMTRNIHEKGS